MTPSRRELWIPFVIFAVTVAAYMPLKSNGFVNYDDNQYITDNPAVRSGLTHNGILWAITSTEVSNWHPLTWISLELDYQLYDLDPWGFHLTNLILHALNA